MSKRRTCACFFGSDDPMEWQVCRMHMEWAEQFAWYYCGERSKWWQILAHPTVDEFRRGLLRMQSSVCRAELCEAGMVMPLTP